MTHNRERLAWTVMLGGFIACCALAVGVPYNVLAYVNSATDVPITIVYSNQGTVQILLSPGTAPTAVNSGVSVTLNDEGNRISTDADAQGGVDFATSEGVPLASVGIYPGSVGIYPGTVITLAHLASPRFTWSPQPRPHELVIEMDSGRAHVEVPDQRVPPVYLTLETKFGRVVLQGAGSYSIEVLSDSVRVDHPQGAVSLNCTNFHTALRKEQSGIMDAQRCTAVTLLERNILKNGDFALPLAGTWEIISRTEPNLPYGTAEVLSDEGRSALRLNRDAQGPGMIGVRQAVGDYSIRDAAAVRLQLQVRIDYQKLDACGGGGTECPLMVKITFQDKDGQERAWLEGFYAEHNDPNIDVRCPNFCAEVHLRYWFRIAPRKWAPAWQSPNLIDEMQRNIAGYKPVAITSIEVYAVGHSYTSFVRDVQLLVRN